MSAPWYAHDPLAAWDTAPVTTPSYLSLEDRPLIVRQLFPADVTLPDGGRHELAQVVLTRAAVYVWLDVGEPVYAALHTDVDLAGTFDPPARPSVVTTADGTVAWVPGQGCGCYHRLKHFRPFAPVRLSS